MKSVRQYISGMMLLSGLSIEDIFNRTIDFDRPTKTDICELNDTLKHKSHLSEDLEFATDPELGEISGLEIRVRTDDFKNEELAVLTNGSGNVRIFGFADYIKSIIEHDFSDAEYEDMLVYYVETYERKWETVEA